MSKYSRIFIVGHSGAGKGILAQEVAKLLGYKFVNADILGSAGHIGRKTVDVLGEEGQKHLDKCFVDIIKHQMTQENIVVTTDEAIINSEEARNLLKSEFTIFLKVSPAIQAGRLSDYRPLLPVHNFEDFLGRMQKELDGFFESVASFSLSSDDGDIEGHASKVVAAFRR